jgi:hypothetical protein
MFEHPDAANVSIQGRNSSWITGEGHINIWVEWARTRFADAELPPSARYGR